MDDLALNGMGMLLAYLIPRTDGPRKDTEEEVRRLKGKPDLASPRATQGFQHGHGLMSQFLSSPSAARGGCDVRTK